MLDTSKQNNTFNNNNNNSGYFLQKFSKRNNGHFYEIKTILVR